MPARLSRAVAVIAIVVGLVGSSLVSLATAAAAAPANDAFAAAQVLPADVPSTTSTSSTGATREPGEPAHAGNTGGASVWFAWTPTASGPVTIDTCDSGFDTLLAVYTGDVLGALTSVASNDDGCGVQSRVDVVVTAGTTYRLAVDGYGGASGAVALRLGSGTPPPPMTNDDFVDAIELTGDLPISVVTTNVGATSENGEPTHDYDGIWQPQASVWYRWTATVTGRVRFDTCDADYRWSRLAVYRGTAVNALDLVVANQDGCDGAPSVAVDVIAGETYAIAVVGNEDPWVEDGVIRTGTATLTISATTAPANDDFADAAALASTLPTHGDGSNRDATAEPGEPLHADPTGLLRDENNHGTSVWYRWTAPTTERVGLSVCGNERGLNLLAVYTGSTLDGLTPVARLEHMCDGDTRDVALPFDAVAGTTYSIAVDGFNGVQGPMVVDLWSLANDAFAGATPLSGDLPIEVQGDSRGASTQPGEPAYVPGGSSVWFSWTPTTDESITIDTCGSGFDTTLGIYIGPAVDQLQTLAIDDDSCGSGSRLGLAGEPDMTYWIAVDGYQGDSGSFVLHLAQHPAPTNDDLAAAEPITGELPVTVDGTLLGATFEPDEPAHGGFQSSASIWYSWVATATGEVSVATCDSRLLDTVVAVYERDAHGDLHLVADDDDGCLYRSQLSFEATAGEVYLIAVAAGRWVTDDVTLRLAPASRPANDSFAAATLLPPELPVSVVGSNREATAELGEPQPLGIPARASLWYGWTPDTSGMVTAQTCGADYDTVVAVYTGIELVGLVEVASNDDRCGRASSVTFPATAGTTYWIAVDGWYGARGSFELTLEPDSRPTNDDFANAQPIAGALPVTVSGDNLEATAEPGEPPHTEGYNGPEPAAASLWYRFTPEATGPVTVEGTCAEERDRFNPIVGVYTGTRVTTLHPVAQTYGVCLGGITFDVAAGITYSIAVDGPTTSGVDVGPFSLTFRAAQPPANDDRADAIDLTGSLPADLVGTNVDATAELGEPHHAGDPGGASVWYRWTAPRDANVTVHNCLDTASLGRLNTTLAVYTGGDPGQLVEVAREAERCEGTGQGWVTFRAVAGTTYWLAVDGFGNSRGRFQLHLRLGPANDDFADAQVLTGALPIRVEGDGSTATVETGEPQAYPWAPMAGVWYRWTPTTTSTVTIDTCDSDGFHEVSIFAGSTLADLDWAPTSGYSRCGDEAIRSFTAVAGTTYHLRVHGGPFVLRIAPAPPPPANDDFAHAVALTGRLPIQARGSAIGAGPEPGEPSIVDNVPLAAQASVWYRWTPARSQLVAIRQADATAGALAVFTGPAVDQLRRVRVTRYFDGAMEFDAVAGTTYWVATSAQDVDFVLTGVRRPANDEFARARVLDGALPLVAVASTVEATSEADEPGYPAWDYVQRPNRSVWFTWTPTASGLMSIETCGSTFVDPPSFFDGARRVLDVWTGDGLADLVPVAAAHRWCDGGVAGTVTFAAVAGTRYRIGVDGDQGSVRLTIRPTARPANDAFAAAVALPGSLPIDVTGTTMDATREPGEPDHWPDTFDDGATSVWYRWTAPSTTRVAIDTCEALDAGLLVVVYTGPDLRHLRWDTFVPCESWIDAVAGTTYHIMVSGRLQNQTPFRLRLFELEVPANDRFTGSTVLSGPMPLQVPGTTFGAVPEPGEPDHSVWGPGYTVWYRWTAPDSRPVTIDTCTSVYLNAITVFRGNELEDLVEVAHHDRMCGLGSMVTFTPVAGTEYRFQVAGSSWDAFTLAVRRPAPPRNDDFARATVLRGDQPHATVSNVDATREVGEPFHGGAGERASVWYRWTPSTAGPVTISTCGSTFSSQLAVYTGSRIDQLHREATGTTGSGSCEDNASLVLDAVAGRTYWIAVDGDDWDFNPLRSEVGTVELQLSR